MGEVLCWVSDNEEAPICPKYCPLHRLCEIMTNIALDEANRSFGEDPLDQIANHDLTGLGEKTQKDIMARQNECTN